MNVSFAKPKFVEAIRTNNLIYYIRRGGISPVEIKTPFSLNKPGNILLDGEIPIYILSASGRGLVKQTNPKDGNM